VAVSKHHILTVLVENKFGVLSRVLLNYDAADVTLAGSFLAGLLAGRRGLQQLDQFSGLLGRQRQRRDAEGGAFGNVLAVGVEHGVAVE